MNGDNRILKWLAPLFVLVGSTCYAQTATINWANTHQVIDGFGGNDIGEFPTGYTMTPAQLAEVFGTTGTELGLSVMRSEVTNGSDSLLNQGSCLTISVSCEGALLPDLVGAASYGVRIVENQGGFPSAYMTNGSVICSTSPGNGTLEPAHYQDMANWQVNFIKSLSTYSGVSVYAINAASEPEYCGSVVDSAEFGDAALDTFIKNYVGPTLASNGLTPILYFPDTGQYANLGDFPTCAEDAACAAYVGAYSYHDYGATGSGLPGTVNAEPMPPSGWTGGKKDWIPEVACQLDGTAPSWCQSGFDPGWIANALPWAAWLDQRLAVDNAGLIDATWWLYVDEFSNNSLGLVESTTLRSGDVYAVSGRAYALAQYSRWVRPGYYRIDATHIPQPGISVTAYRDVPSGHLVIVATNYTAAPVTQTFSFTNAPTFTSITPYISSATQNIQEQTAQSVSSDVFSYALPADSVTTFVGTSSTSASPTAPTDLRATVN